MSQHIAGRWYRLRRRQLSPFPKQYGFALEVNGRERLGLYVSFGVWPPWNWKHDTSARLRVVLFNIDVGRWGLNFYRAGNDVKEEPE